MLAGAEGFAPAGATKGLSGRPLETFGPILGETLGGWEPVVCVGTEGLRALGYFPGLWEQIAAPGAYRRGPWFIAGLLLFVLQTLHLVELAHRVL